MTERAINMKAKKYLELKAEYDALEKRLEKLKKEIQADIGDQTVLETNKYTLQSPFISRGNFDTNTFKAKHPELYNIFNKTITYRTLKVIEKGA